MPGYTSLKRKAHKPAMAGKPILMKKKKKKGGGY